MSGILTEEQMKGLTEGDRRKIRKVSKQYRSLNYIVVCQTGFIKNGADIVHCLTGLEFNSCGYGTIDRINRNLSRHKNRPVQVYTL